MNLIFWLFGMNLLTYADADGFTLEQDVKKLWKKILDII